MINLVPTYFYSFTATFKTSEICGQSNIIVKYLKTLSFVRLWTKLSKNYWKLSTAFQSMSVFPIEMNTNIVLDNDWSLWCTGKWTSQAWVICETLIKVRHQLVAVLFWCGQKTSVKGLFLLDSISSSQISPLMKALNHTKAHQKPLTEKRHNSTFLMFSRALPPGQTAASICWQMFPRLLYKPLHFFYLTRQKQWKVRKMYNFVFNQSCQQQMSITEYKFNNTHKDTGWS